MILAVNFTAKIILFHPDGACYGSIDFLTVARSAQWLLAAVSSHG
jgi:hypothetical protein